MLDKVQSLVVGSGVPETNTASRHAQGSTRRQSRNPLCWPARNLHASPTITNITATTTSQHSMLDTVESLVGRRSLTETRTTCHAQGSAHSPASPLFFWPADPYVCHTTPSTSRKRGRQWAKSQNGPVNPTVVVGQQSMPSIQTLPSACIRSLWEAAGPFTTCCRFTSSVWHAAACPFKLGSHADVGHAAAGRSS